VKRRETFLAFKQRRPALNALALSRQSFLSQSANQRAREAFDSIIDFSPTWTDRSREAYLSHARRTTLTRILKWRRLRAFPLIRCRYTAADRPLLLRVSPHHPRRSSRVSWPRNSSPIFQLQSRPLLPPSSSSSVPRAMRIPIRRADASRPPQFLSVLPHFFLFPPPLRRLGAKSGRT